jgi:hypothetical protein
MAKRRKNEPSRKTQSFGRQRWCMLAGVDRSGVAHSVVAQQCIAISLRLQEEVFQT